ncbi:DUF4136 domain-containing protein [Chryseolinea lacunae]|uniref:DUF4136 domain-containing protein n=1 Tax=Chryseolinea lacunae TaxID=2801331 RepID=A0ABS1KKV5_9BACT|nr:DUF4136 domain-containing protein [Chryseolinea lacunae]MBL0740099.1 DUF4136 domain-containing protein [Chryseolinea lacunae]
MTSFLRTLCVIFLLCCGACSGVRVLNTDKADGFQIGQYKTFEFYAIEADGDTVSPTFHKNVDLLKTAVRRQLEARGLKATTERPDLLVNIGVMVENKIQTRSTSIQEAPRYMGQRKYSWKSEEVEVGRYREGTATVHLVEAASNKLVWKGAVAGVVPDNPEKVGPMIEEGITALFAKL